MQAGFLEKLNSEIILKDYEPPEPEDNEVTIEQKYTGVCFRDILTQQGFFPRVSLPIIPGHEIGGTIIKKERILKALMLEIGFLALYMCHAENVNSVYPEMKIYALIKLHMARAEMGDIPDM